MNRLQFETSPYLLQHKNNPVGWFPWGDEALQTAQSQNKLLIISVGYAACHWCHVMEKECFENEEVAAVMNGGYISIKVDREERPDIDQVYMNAAMITTGQGGWPLNVIALPDGKPVYAGTYFPKQNWMHLLRYFADMYQQSPEKLMEQAQRITQGLQQIEQIPLYPSERVIDEGMLHIIWNSCKDKLDMEWGGKTGAPKFMMPNNFEFLWRYYYRTQHKDVAAYLKTSLKKMAFGGLHDIVGGGFARYSVDAYWKVPHFEKMLYDNAQMMTIYAHGYQLTQRPMYKSVVENIFEWTVREMTAPEGGLYASLDADSEGVEGKFYCWTKTEFIQEVEQLAYSFITPEIFISLALELYNITEDGNFEHGMNVLFRTEDHEYFMEKYGLTNAEFQTIVSGIQQQLLKARSGKIRPATDDKILTEWNAMMVKGLTDAYRALGEEKYKQKAIAIADFILHYCMQPDGRLYRNYKDGKCTINAFLPDYAFLIDALLALHSITLQEKYLDVSAQLMDYVIQHFYEPSNGFFYITSNLDAPLVVRNMDSSDNVIPSANSMMAKNLLLLGKLLDNNEYMQMSMTMLNNVLNDVLHNPLFYSNWAIVLDMQLHLRNELIITGRDAEHALSGILPHYTPDVLISGCTAESNKPLTKHRYVSGKTLYYWCFDKSCTLPEENQSIIVDRINNLQKL